MWILFAVADFVWPLHWERLVNLLWRFCSHSLFLSLQERQQKKQQRRWPETAIVLPLAPSSTSPCFLFLFHHVQFRVVLLCNSFRCLGWGRWGIWERFSLHLVVCLCGSVLARGRGSKERVRAVCVSVCMIGDWVNECVRVKSKWNVVRRDHHCRVLYSCLAKWIWDVCQLLLLQSRMQMSTVRRWKVCEGSLCPCSFVEVYFVCPEFFPVTV